jgi:hypothetical protein
LKLKLKLIYDRLSVGQSVLVSGAHLGRVTNFSFSLKFPLDNYGFVICSALSDESTGLKFTYTIASGPCQSSHSWVEIPKNSRPYFTVSSETPPTWRARFRIYIPQEHGDPVIPPGTGLPFYRLLRLAGTTVEVF